MMTSVARLIALVGLLVGTGSDALAQPVGELSGVQPSAVLVMPFDVTTNHTSFMTVSRIGASFGSIAVDTHWVFYSADCSHLADLSIVLTDNDTIVVDASRIQSQRQDPGVPENVPRGAVVDLSGQRGIVTVTVRPPPGVSPAQIVGAWVIGDLAASVAFGTDAVGFPSFTLPDPSVFAGLGLMIPTFDPGTLDTSQVIVIGLEQQGDSLVPIARPSAALGGAHVCCNAAFSDTLETIVSVPDVCLACALFAPIAPTRRPNDDPPVLPLASSPTTAGLLYLSACRSAGQDGLPAPLGQGGFSQYLVAFHGQAVGPFGVVTSGKYDRVVAD
jgi:hypothetical protein